MLVLGIESSCDETGIALYDTTHGLLSNQVYSQIALHAPYGGVVPELASRDHLRHMLPLMKEGLIQAQRNLNQIDAIAYTAGPGLAGALLVGAGFAHGLALSLNKPIIPVHHLEGHLLSPLLSKPAPTFPFVALLVSGGHTQLIAVEEIGHYQLLGDTLDDAAGEAFDKSAKSLGLDYPGGPALAKLAQQGDPNRFQLPRPMRASNNLDMSFSGLKTAVFQLVKKLTPLDTKTRADICAAVQEAIVDILIDKSLAAVTQSGFKQLVVAGGVSANTTLRRKLRNSAKKRGIKTCYPPSALYTDNGAMIAFTGAQRIAQAQSPGNFSIHTRWELTDLDKIGRF